MAEWKQSLVDQVKAWQKMSGSHKEAWYRFVQENTGNSNFDPARHDEATLTQFTEMADAGMIELKPEGSFGGCSKGKGKGGGVWGGDGGWAASGVDMSAGKQELVMQVKNWQKMSASHKEAWYRFVQEKTGETHFDPNRHDEATLMEFITMADSGLVELKEATGFGSSGPKKGKGGCGGDGGWGGGGGWGGDGNMMEMMQAMMNTMMAGMGKGGKGCGGKGGKGWGGGKSGPY